MFAKLCLGNKVIVIVNILICNWIYFLILGESKRKTSISLMTYDLITLIAILYNSCHIEGTHTRTIALSIRKIYQSQGHPFNLSN